MLSWGHSLPCSSKYLQNKTGKKSFLFLLFKVPIRLTEESCTSSWCPPSKGVKKKKGEKVITLLLLLTRPRLCHFQIKPVFYTTYSERPPTPPLPNFTFASLGLLLNQVMRKHKNDFSDRIIMDGIVKKKALNCSLAWIITEDEESPSWDLFSVVVRTGGRDSLSIKSDRKCLSFFIQKGFCISKCVAPV